jgi:tellurite resistance protein TehA-like permease
MEVEEVKTSVDFWIALVSWILMVVSWFVYMVAVSKDWDKVVFKALVCEITFTLICASAMLFRAGVILVYGVAP